MTLPESREMARLYAEGWSYRKIGARFGRARTTVKWHVRFNGVRPRSAAEAAAIGGQTGSVRVPADEILRVAEMYAAGMSQDEIRAAMGFRSRDSVRVRLEHSAVGTRTRSEALLMSSHPRRLSDETVARIVELHGTGWAYEVAEQCGVTVHTVTRTWLRHGLDVPKGRRANQRTHGRISASEAVPVAPLVAAVDRFAERESDREIDLADAAGIDARRFRAWREGAQHTHVDLADRVLVALDLMWWEVYDPSLAPLGGEEVWRAACERARKLWGDG